MKKVEVVWLDACDHKVVFLEDITDSRKYLLKRKSTGWLAIKDTDGIVIITDIDEDNYCEVTAIPEQMIVSVK